MPANALEIPNHLRSGSYGGMRYGEKIERARRAAGLTQAKLGEIIGKDQGTISAWENDRYNPSLDDMVALSGATNSSLNELFYGDAAVAEVAALTDDEEFVLEVFRSLNLDRRIAIRALSAAAYQPVPPETPNQKMPNIEQVRDSGFLIPNSAATADMPPKLQSAETVTTRAPASFTPHPASHQLVPEPIPNQAMKPAKISGNDHLMVTLQLDAYADFLGELRSINLGDIDTEFQQSFKKDLQKLVAAHLKNQEKKREFAKKRHFMKDIQSVLLDMILARSADLQLFDTWEEMMDKHKIWDKLGPIVKEMRVQNLKSTEILNNLYAKYFSNR